MTKRNQEKNKLDLTSAIVHARISSQPTIIRETKYINQTIIKVPPAFSITHTLHDTLMKKTTRTIKTGRRKAQAVKLSGTHHSPDR